MSKPLLRWLKRLFAVGFIVATTLAAWRMCETRETKALQSELAAIHEERFGDALTIEETGKVRVKPDLLEADPLKLRNPDYLGWLKVYGVGIDLPVVLGRDNSFYLNHSFDREYLGSGCLFADSETNRDADGNLIIYGHHMGDGTMFGSLRYFYDFSFFEKNELALWQKDERAWMYRIFALLVIPGEPDAGDYFPLEDYMNLIDANQTRELIASLHERAMYWRDIELTENDRFLFLVTCDYTRDDGRLMLCARRID